MSEVSFYGVRPTARLGARLSLLPQHGKDGCHCLPERARSKQPERSCSKPLKKNGSSGRIRIRVTT